MKDETLIKNILQNRSIANIFVRITMKYVSPSEHFIQMEYSRGTVINLKQWRS